MDEPPALAPAPELTSAGEEPPVAAPGDADGRSWAGVAAPPPAAAAAASAEKRRVEFDAEQSPARRGRPGADSPPVPSVDEESRQLEGKLSALCAQCRRSEQNSYATCPHGKTLRRRLAELRVLRVSVCLRPTWPRGAREQRIT